MSKLTETVCIKVSKDTKQFLDELDNSSKFIRDLLIRSQTVKDRLEPITTVKMIDGEKMIGFDEEQLDAITQDLSRLVYKEIFTHALKITEDK